MFNKIIWYIHVIFYIRRHVFRPFKALISAAQRARRTLLSWKCYGSAERRMIACGDERVYKTLMSCHFFNHSLLNISYWGISKTTIIDNSVGKHKRTLPDCFWLILPTGCSYWPYLKKGNRGKVKVRLYIPYWQRAKYLSKSVFGLIIPSLWVYKKLIKKKEWNTSPLCISCKFITGLFWWVSEKSRNEIPFNLYN